MRANVLIRRAALLATLFISLLGFSQSSAFASGSVTLSWTAVSDPSVAGYRIYYGVASRTYTNMVDVGTNTTVTISNLPDGVTFYFAATCYNVLGMESSYSAETTYTTPITITYLPPTLNVLNNLAITQNAGQQTVNLSGITSGSTNALTLTVTSSSGNTGVIPNPTVHYTSPNATGTLTFTPVANAVGSSTITVTVNNGQPTNNTISRTFTVTVTAAPVYNPPTLNALSPVTIVENAGQQTVNLAGITSGTTNAVTLSVAASSGNTGVVPNPTVHYTSPNSTGTLTFTPVANAFGSSLITVTVNNGQPSNSTVTQTFTVTVDAPPRMSGITTNVTMAANTNFGPILFTIGDPDTALGSLTLRATSSSSALIPTNGIAFGGSGSNRTVTLTPLPDQSGTATIAIVLSDGMQSVSNVIQLTVLTAPPAPTGLTVVATGDGTIVTNAIRLASGELKYTLSAVPGPGQIFAGWEGSTNTSTARINVVVTNAVVLHAVFIPNPFTPIQGLYSGLFYEAGGIELRSAGYFTVLVAAKGTYTGKLYFGGKPHSFSGQLGLATQATNHILMPDRSTAVLTFAFEGKTVSGQLSAGAWTADLQGDRAVYNTRTNVAPFAGTYTVVVPGQSTNSAKPMGSGYGSVKIGANGAARFAGVLADGTKFTQSTILSQDGQWPLYASLYGGKGLVISWLNMSNSVASDLNGALSWIKSAGASKTIYTNGFIYETVALGSAYHAPVAPASLLNFTAGELVASGGSLDAAIGNSVTLAGTKASGANASVNFSASTGLFTGRTTDTNSGKTYAFGGAVLQKGNAGYGFLLNAGQSSEVSLTSAAQ